MFNLTKHWYRKSLTWLTVLLLPLSWLFGVMVQFRRWCYRKQFKKTIHFSVPIIVVGNITVGGTGKTPFVIWLADMLKQEGFKPGVVSRGVGGSKQYLPLLVDAASDPANVGDESVLLAKKTGCPVVICIDRVAAVNTLLAAAECDVVISDDGLQHYRLGRSVEVALIDGDRDLGNGCLLPAGPLREPVSRLKEVDLVVTHGVHGKLTMQLQGDILRAVVDDQTQALASIFQKTVHAVAGIGNPDRFFNSLRERGITVIEHVFPDHHLYSARDFQFSDNQMIIMTEKDAVKCKSFADHRFWYLPVRAVMDEPIKTILLKKLNQ